MSGSLRERARRTSFRVAVALAACAMILGAVLYAKNLLTEETAQATTLVVDGQRALAHDDHATAALDFERARWLAPRAAVVRAAVVSAGIKDAEPILPRTLRFVTGPEWTALAVGSGWLAGTALLIFISRKKPRKALPFALAMGGAFLLGTAAVGVESAASPSAITLADAPLLVAPYASAESEASVPAGTMVIVGTPYQDFVQVKDGDGTRGWVRRKNIELIASDHPES